MLPPLPRPTLPTQNALPALSFHDGKKLRVPSRLQSISERSPHTATTSAESQAQPASSSEQAPRLRVIDCISACVEADVSSYAALNLLVLLSCLPSSLSGD